MKNNYFKSCTTIEEAKKLYKQLAKKYHPDLGGSTEEMQEINSQFDEIIITLEKQENKTNTVNLDAFKDIINSIIHLNIDIEIIGTWIWVTGDTYNVKNILKENGFQWGSKKKAWYWHEGEYHKFGKKKYELNDIRAMYGSEKIKESKRENIKSLA